jgi:hypothetical protein
MISHLSHQARSVSGMASKREGLPEFESAAVSTPEPRVLAIWPTQNGNLRRSIMERMQDAHDASEKKR